MDELVAIVCRQTAYSEAEARERLMAAECDPKTVIKEYFRSNVGAGTHESACAGAKRRRENRTLVGSQLIYKQCRDKLDNDMRQYTEHVEHIDTAAAAHREQEALPPIEGDNVVVGSGAGTSTNNAIQLKIQMPKRAT